MVRCFFCYQVVDPFQASSDFSVPVIPTTLCCLQQACIQFICNQIIWHFIFLSSLCWIIFVELSGLVAKNAYILVQEVNWLDLQPVDALSSELVRLLFNFDDSFSAFDVWADFLMMSTKLLYIIIFTLYVVSLTSVFLSFEPPSYVPQLWHFWQLLRVSKK